MLRVVFYIGDREVQTVSFPLEPIEGNIGPDFVAESVKYIQENRESILRSLAE